MNLEFSIVILFIIIITESKEVSSLTGALEERDKEIERMRTEIQRLQQGIKYTLSYLLVIAAR